TTVYDGIDNSTSLNSSNITILAVPNTAPSLTLSLKPTTAYTNDTLNVTANYTDANSDTGTVYFNWFLNDTISASTSFGSISANANVSDNLTSGNFSRWTNVTVQATPYDGTENGTAVNVSINISNFVPEVTSLLLNGSSGNYTTENITAYIEGLEIDEDDTVKNITNWYVNGSTFALINMPFESGSNSTFTKNYAGSDGAPYGAIWNATGGYDGRGAYNFSRGDGDVYINITNDGRFDIEANESITIIARFKANAFGDGYLWRQGHGDYYGRPYANAFAGGFNNGSGDTTFNVPYTFNLGQWYSIAMTWNRTVLKYYIDGVYQTGKDDLFALDSTIGTGEVFQIGGDSNSPNDFEGSIDDFMFFKKVLSEEQIKAIHNDTSLIVSQETSIGDNWSACVTPNDGVGDGTEVCSANLTVLEVPNSAPSLTLSLKPTTAYTNNTLNVTANYTDANSDTGTVYFDWFINGTINASTSFGSISANANVSDNLTSGNFSRWTNVTVQVVPYDGTENGTAVNVSINISNSVAYVNSTTIFSPDNITTTPINGTITFHDEDVDQGIVYFDWFVNDTINYSETIAGANSGDEASRNLSSGNFTADNVVILQTTVYDGIDNSTSLNSSNITILAVPNTAPALTLSLKPITAYTNNTLNVTANYTDVNSDTGTVYFDWFINNTWNTSTSFGSISTNANVSDNLTSGNFSRWTNVTVQATPFDGTENGTAVNVSINISNIFPQQIGLALSPDTIYANSTNLNASVVVWDDDQAEGTTLTAYFDWFINGINQYANFTTGLTNGTNVSAYLNPSNFSKWDNVTAQIVIYDGYENSSAVNSSWLNVSGYDPELTLSLKPTTAYTNNTLNVTANYTDADSDIGIVYFDWFKNNTYYTSTSFVGINTGMNVSDNLSSGNFSRWDNVTVQATPNDGIVNGTAVNVSINISNFIPEITSLLLNGSGNNYSTENITAYISTLEIDGNDTVKNITNWYINGSSIALVNMPFENNGTEDGTTDYSGYGNEGSLNNVTWNATGGFDGRGAYAFDGNNGTYIELSSSVLGNEQHTVCTWFYADSINDTNGDIIYAERSSSSSDPITGQLYLSQGNISYIVRDNLGVEAIAKGDPINLNTWHHACGVRDGSNVYVYLNGRLNATESNTFGTITVDKYSIGGYYWANGGSHRLNWNGTIDEFMIFNRSLSSQEILALYEAQENILVSDELNNGDNVSACITPNDGIEDGIEVCSENLTVLAPPNVAPSLTLSLKPTTAYTNNTLNVTANYVDANSDIGTVYFDWFINGTLNTNTSFAGISTGTNVSDNLTSGNFSMWTNVTVQATPFDGTVNGTAVNVSINISNSLPYINLTDIYSPDNCSTSQINASGVLDDKDGDSLIYYFDWFVESANNIGINYSEIITNVNVGDNVSRNLTTGNFTIGDVVTLQITSNDGLSNGSATNTTSMTILDCSAPVIVPGDGVAGGGGSGGGGETIDYVDWLDVAIITFDSPLQPGDFLDFTYLIKNMVSDSGDITVEFWLEGKDGIVTEGTDVIYFSAFQEKTTPAKLFLPTDADAGIYNLYVKATFGNYDATSARTISVLDVQTPELDLELKDLVEFQELVDNVPWEFSFVLNTGLESSVLVNLDMKISGEEGLVWSKTSDVSIIQEDEFTYTINGLNPGEYQLELEAKSGYQTVSLFQTFNVMAPQEPSEKDLSGKAFEIPKDEKKIRLLILIMLLILLLLTLLGYVPYKIYKYYLFKKSPDYRRWIRQIHIDEFIHKRRWTRHIPIDNSIQQLKKYVGNQLRKGRSRNDISKALLKKGWSTETVYYALYMKDVDSAITLRNYTVKQLKKGAKLNDIKAVLLKKGWDKEFVKDVLRVINYVARSDSGTNNVLNRGGSKK
ncbi:LamG domain-containing protein, partial [Candidatus Woesearchaeota archaeon]|nr:LamG domain-containing protein [Candidatus Woesearchaeota archaeon]